MTKLSETDLSKNFQTLHRILNQLNSTDSFSLVFDGFNCCNETLHSHDLIDFLKKVTKLFCYYLFQKKVTNFFSLDFNLSPNSRAI